MKDACFQEIVPIKEKLTIHTNRHPDNYGNRFGWIEGCDTNIIWCDGSHFNFQKALKYVKDHNKKL